MEQPRTYNRVNDRWVCGNKVNCCPCRKGPDKKGNCGAGPQCSPVKFEDRWQCTRSTVAGGKCAQGPAPDGSCCQSEQTCAPIPGYPQKRRHYLQLTALFILTLLLLGLSPQVLEEFANPGPLTQPHAGIAQCQSCHTSKPSLELMGIVTNAFKPMDIATHNQQCSSCHAMGENSVNPHQLTQQKVNETKLAIPMAHQQGLACASCHKEHQQQLIPDKQTQTSYCLACHEKPIYRFPDNHPEFIDYPIKIVKRIKFNHQNHIDRLFAKKPEFAPDNCASCHSIDRSGIPTVASFESSCKNCHQQDVLSENLASGPKGFAVISLPGIDIETLQANNIDIGQWPQFSEEPVHPVWQHILPGMTTSEDFLDLTDASPELLKHTQSVALNIKKYLYQVSLYGSSQGSSEGSQDWTLQLSQGELLNALYNWFPDIDKEIPLINAGTPPPTRNVIWDEQSEDTTSEQDNSEESFNFDDESILGEDDEDSLEDDSNFDDLFGDTDDSEITEPSSSAKDTVEISSEQWMKQGGWYLQDFALYYRSTGHADSNLKLWISNAPELFDEDSSGRCLKCHSIDSNSPANWQTQQRNTIAAKLTAFDHRQHMNMVDTDSCQNCHSIAEHSEQKLDFDPIKKQQCLSCHNEETQLNQCSACHNYHLPWAAIDFTPKSSFDQKTNE